MKTGRPPSEESEFFLEWGRESLKANLKFANDILRQLVTLNATFLGGSIVFLDRSLIPSPYREIAIVLFFAALVVAFIGMMPYEANVPLRMPFEIKKHKEQALASKRRYLWTAGGLMASAFGTLAATIIINYLQNIFSA